MVQIITYLTKLHVMYDHLLWMTRPSRYTTSLPFMTEHLKKDLYGRDLFIDYGVSIVTSMVKLSCLSLGRSTALSLDRGNDSTGQGFNGTHSTGPTH